MGLFELLPSQIENRCWVFALHCAAHRKHQAVLAVTERVQSRLISPEIPRLLDHPIAACYVSVAPRPAQTATDKTRSQAAAELRQTSL